MRRARSGAPARAPRRCAHRRWRWSGSPLRRHRSGARAADRRTASTSGAARPAGRPAAAARTTTKPRCPRQAKGRKGSRCRRSRRARGRPGSPRARHVSSGRKSTASPAGDAGGGDGQEAARMLAEEAEHRARGVGALGIGVAAGRRRRPTRRAAPRARASARPGSAHRAARRRHARRCAGRDGCRSAPDPRRLGDRVGHAGERCVDDRLPVRRDHGVVGIAVEDDQRRDRARAFALRRWIRARPRARLGAAPSGTAARSRTSSPRTRWRRRAPLRARDRSGRPRRRTGRGIRAPGSRPSRRRPRGRRRRRGRGRPDGSA